MKRGAALVVLALVATSSAKGETFLKSDDYEDGEVVVGVFLHDADYALMLDDFQRNDTEFDWGWVKTSEVPAPEGTSTGFVARLKKLHHKRPDTHHLGFDVHSYKSVWVPDVQNFAGLVPPGVLLEIRENFLLATASFGLKPAASREGADVELGLALIDVMRSTANVPVYGIQIQPFVLMELRLVDVKTGEALLLVRNRKHGGTVTEASFNFADDLAKFLR